MDVIVSVDGILCFMVRYLLLTIFLLETNRFSLF